MIDQHQSQSSHTSQQTAPGAIAQLPAWKKFLLLCSIGLMVVAGGLTAWGAVSGDSAAPRSTDTAPNGVDPDLIRGFAPSGTGSEAGDDAVMDDPSRYEQYDWSPALFKLGFSFFVGFAIAFALRTFVKISMVALGMFLLLHFALQYYGFIEINWNALGERYDSIADWLSEQTGGFRAFITGSLPSAAAAGTGLVLGFRRN